jgi:hypothetical protein
MAADGAVATKSVEASSLRFTWGPYVLEVARAVVQELAGHIAPGGLQAQTMQLAQAELGGVKIHGPVDLPEPASGGAWMLEPLATLEGTIRSKIVDAHLLFDADVTVPIRAGGIRFNDATVEHVGPDSRMGVSKMGLYVDAPNGRSYLYQFPSTPVDGIEYETRGAMLGPWVSERGSLALQPFVESMLQQGALGAGAGFTEQSKLLFERTSLSGDLQPGDGQVSALGMHGELSGRAQGRNAIRLLSESVGRGVTAEMPALSMRHLTVDIAGMQLACEQVEASLTLRLFVERGRLQFLLEAASVKLVGLRLASAGTA